MVQTLPQVRIFQEFTTATATTVEPLRAFLMGPHYSVRTYDTAKSDIGVGAYTADAATTYAYPGRLAGETVDLSFVRVFIDDALIRYYIDTDGSPAVDPVAPNTVVLGGAYGWADVDAYTRLAAIPKDVVAGDYVRLTDPNDPSSTLLSQVRELRRAAVASSHASTATVDASNAATSTATATPISAPGGTPYTVAVSTSTYKPYIAGILGDRYTFTVTTGGGSGAAKMRVSTDSGLDIDTDVTITAGVPLTFGDFGLTIQFTGSGSFAVGEQWVFDVLCDFTAPVGANVTAAGTYTGTDDETYILEVTTGGVVGTDSPTFVVTTSNGTDAGGPYSAVTTATAIGVGGLTIAWANAITLRKGDRYTVAATAAAEGRVSTLVLADTVPSALASLSSVDVELFVKQNVELTQKQYNNPTVSNWTAAAASITVAANAVHYDEADTVLSGMVIRGGTVYIGYRALDPTYTSAIQTIADVAELSTYFDDLTPNNPLAYGVKKALENANGTDVKFIAVAADTLSGYTAALNKTLELENVYSFVPLTSAVDVVSAVASHVDAQSTPDKGRWRIAWVSQPKATTARVVGVDSGTPKKATITAYSGDLAGTYRLVTSSTATFITSGVRAGDSYRYAYGLDSFGAETYATDVVDAVISETQLVVLAGPAAPVNTASKFEIHRAYTTDETVAALVAGNTFSSRRVYNVFSGAFSADGYTDLPDYYLAAAWAGYRGGVLPHQGLTNAAVSGVTATPYTTDTLTATQLDTLMSAGFWLTQQDAVSGDLYCRKELSTDLTDLNSSEQMVTTNVDSISYFQKKILAPYIGRTNNVASTQQLIRGDIEASYEYFASNASPTLGAQLLEGTTIVSIATSAVSRDRLEIRQSLVIPYALNNIDVTLVV